jgi:hypothetical protein
MSGVTETVEVDPTQAVGRLLPEGWRVGSTHGFDGGVWLYALGATCYSPRCKRVPHGETVTVVVEPADVATATRQAVQ